jgi:hypothetical protein
VELTKQSPADETDFLLLKRRKLQLLREKARLKKECGVAFYTPHEKQQAFHEAAWARRRMFAAGNRTGKSTAGCAEDCGYFMGERLWYPKDHPLRKLGIPDYPTKGIVVCADWGKVDSVFTGQGASGQVGKLWKLLPPGFVVKTKKTSNGVIDYLEGANGSLVRFETVRSYKQDAMSAESEDWDWAHYDEPVPKGLRDAIARGGMDRGMKEWYTLTPLSELWIYDLFFPRDGSNAGLFTELDGGVFQSEENRSWAIRASTFDNPYLNEVEMADFEKELTDDVRQCRIHGIPLELSGLVYKEFKYNEHVLTEVPHGWADFNSPPASEYVLYLSIDVHFKKPHAVLFCFVNPLDQCFFAYEVFQAGTISQLCELIREKAAPYRLAPIKCDPLAWTPDPVTGSCMAREFVRNGIAVHKASKALDFGILAVKEALRTPGYLHFSPNLKRTLYEFNNYVYNHQTNKPIAEDNDMMEALYRLMINRPVWFEHESDQSLDSLEIPPEPIDPFEGVDESLEWDMEPLEI